MGRLEKIVREAYGKIVHEGQKGCKCCVPDTKEFAKSIGYYEVLLCFFRRNHKFLQLKLAIWELVS